MTASEPELRLRRTDWRRVGDETVVLDLATERYLSLNRSGTVIWERLAEGATRSALVRALVDAFGLAEDRAGADVDAFVAELRDNGLLEA